MSADFNGPSTVWLPPDHDLKPCCKTTRSDKHRDVFAPRSALHFHHRIDFLLHIWFSSGCHELTLQHRPLRWSRLALLLSRQKCPCLDPILSLIRARATRTKASVKSSPVARRCPHTSNARWLLDDVSCRGYVPATCSAATRAYSHSDQTNRFNTRHDVLCEGSLPLSLIVDVRFGPRIGWTPSSLG